MNKSNQQITFKGSKVNVSGTEIHEGDTAPAFTVTGRDLADLSLDSFNGKVVVLSSIPSIDTPVCQVETRRFNEEISKLGDGVVLLTVSMDLPFAQSRWCGAEGIDKVVCGSDYKHRSFGEQFGVYMPDLGLLARAVFVVGVDRIVHHVEYVDAIEKEPNYEAAIEATRALLG